MSVRAYLDYITAAGEGRRHARLHLRLVTSGAGPDGAEANVLIHNASISGMLLETDLELALGDILRVDLPETPPVTARVAWADDRLFGCEFSTPISPAILSAAQLRSETGLSQPIGAAQPGFRPAEEGLGHRIEQLRKERGLTLADIATQLGVSKPTVWAWEKGKARPIEDRLPAIAAALGVEPSVLTSHADQAGMDEVIRTSRANIARACGVSEDKVKILIEL